MRPAGIGRALIALSLGAAISGKALATEPQAQAYQDALALRQQWRYLTRDVPFPATWSGDGSTIFYKKSEQGGFAWIALDVNTGTRKPAFDRNRLAAGLSQALGSPITAADLPFDRFAVDDRPARVSFTLHDDPWSCDMADYHCAAISDGTRPRGFSAVRDLRVPPRNTPTISPDGQWDAYVCDDNLVLRAHGSNEARALSHDGSTGDFYDPESISWSPDSRSLFIVRVRPGYARYVQRVESSPTDQVQPKLRSQLYPKPGDAIDTEQAVLFDIASGHGTQIASPALKDIYPLPAPVWSEDSTHLLISFIGRGYQRAGIVSVARASGAAHLAVDEQAKSFVDGDRIFSKVLGRSGNEIVWASERDGWRHLYVFDTETGQVKTRITQGKWVVREILRIDEHTGQLIFGASGMDDGEDPYFVHYYRINLDGTGLVPLTPERANHHASVSPDGALLIDTYSRPDLAPVSVLRDAMTGKIRQSIEHGDDHLLRAAGFRPPEIFHAKGRDHQSDIWGIVVRPLHYDPKLRYPVIENIYAGPHDNFVPKDFWPFGYHSGGDKVVGMQELADLGFIVVQIDGMGTANRSRAFHDVAWKNLEDSGFPDRILWHRAMAARDPSYDISRVGIYGGSAGGQSTLNALLFHPEFYKAGVAFAGCYDNRMDKISWNEQWLGWPVDESYARASGVVNAHLLRGQLLMIVGEQDENVDPASTMQVANALIRAGKDFDLLVVPGAGHAAGRSEEPIAYAQRREFGFFVRNLLGAPEPHWNSLSLPLTQTP